MDRFEKEIHLIKYRINRNTFKLISMIGLFLILSIVLLLLKYPLYSLLILLLGFLLFIILMTNKITLKKLDWMLTSYKIDKDEVIDYLNILIRNYETNKNNNLYLKYSYKNMITHYNNALEALVKEE